MKLAEKILKIFEISFSDTKVGIPKYDDMIADPEYYAKSKKIFFKIVNIPPLEYVKVAADDFKKEQAISYVDLIKSRLKNKGNLEKLKDVKNSDILLFDFSNDYMSQEGLHRAIVAHRQKLKEVPVMVVYKDKKQLPTELKRYI